MLVAGLGTSGRAAVAALYDADAVVSTYDDHAADADLRSCENLDLSVYDLVVTSPGLPPHHDLLAAALDAGVMVVSEVELAWW
ncbi:MAG: UDP-N-acetylmuramoyl-L-alanine--D-glutamate ligase, partial [Micrococcales bacterium]|nr:UDP-N-acetylmuramoyl-L-alanine--D-glutamate ligase [Micrococcales bacterium]